MGMDLFLEKTLEYLTVLTVLIFILCDTQEINIILAAESQKGVTSYRSTELSPFDY